MGSGERAWCLRHEPAPAPGTAVKIDGGVLTLCCCKRKLVKQHSRACTHTPTHAACVCGTHMHTCTHARMHAQTHVRQPGANLYPRLRRCPGHQGRRHHRHQRTRQSRWRAWHPLGAPLGRSSCHCRKRCPWELQPWGPPWGAPWGLMWVRPLCQKGWQVPWSRHLMSRGERVMVCAGPDGSTMCMGGLSGGASGLHPYALGAAFKGDGWGQHHARARVGDHRKHPATARRVLCSTLPCEQR